MKRDEFYKEFFKKNFKKCVNPPYFLMHFKPSCRQLTDGVFLGTKHYPTSRRVIYNLTLESGDALKVSPSSVEEGFADKMFLPQKL